MTSVFKKLQENIEFTGFCFKIPDVSRNLCLNIVLLESQKVRNTSRHKMKINVMFTLCRIAFRRVEKFVPARAFVYT